MRWKEGDRMGRFQKRSCLDANQRGRVSVDAALATSMDVARGGVR